MVRNYIKKSQRKTWSKDAMRMAIEAVIQQGVSIRRASIENKVPHATLSRKIHQCRIDPQKGIELITNPKGSNFQTVFTREQEMILCQYIKTLENSMIGLTGPDIRRLAFQVAEKFKLRNRFNKEVKIAGEDWYRAFLKRNPEVAMKRADTLTNKSKEFNKDYVHKFFDLLESTIDVHELKPSHIYSLDESVITCVSKSDSKAGSLHTTSEQNKLVTAIMCFSASGVYIPLMLILPNKIKSKILHKGGPSHIWTAYDCTGQMQLDIFIKWLKKFILFTNSSKNSPVLLLVNEYRSYFKNLQVLELIIENGVNIICLPPNSSEKLHPMHYSFLQTLSNTYTTEVLKCSDSNPGSSVSVAEVFHIFGNVFRQVSNTFTPANSFYSTGIWPVNRGIFEDCIPSIKDESCYSTEYDSKVTVELYEKTVQEVSQMGVLNESLNKSPLTLSNNCVDKSMMIATHENNEPKLQSLSILNQENEQLLQQSCVSQEYVQQQYSVIKVNTIPTMEVENIILKSHEKSEVGEMSSSIIPAENQLLEVKIDLQSLIKNQRNL